MTATTTSPNPPTSSPDSQDGPSPETLLHIYLNDHRAGAAGGLALTRRMAQSNAGTPLGDLLEVIAGELEEDAALLDRIREHLGVKPNLPKQAAAWLAAQLGRLKLNGQLRGYSPLSRVLEIEALLGGIDMRRSLWRSFEVHPTGAAIAGADPTALIARADSQRERLIPHHREAAVAAFGPDIE